jgi:hypothetical protein
MRRFWGHRNDRRSPGRQENRRNAVAENCGGTIGRTQKIQALQRFFRGGRVTKPTLRESATSNLPKIGHFLLRFYAPCYESFLRQESPGTTRRC